MAVLISTNMYAAKEFNRILAYVKAFDGAVGVEIFPMFHETEYEQILKDCIPVLSGIPISFHEPYYKADHTAPVGSDRYKKTMEMMKKTLEYGSILKSRYVVFHHNNCRVDAVDKQRLIRVSCGNFRETEELCESYGIPIVVENAGVIDRGNMLLNQKEFTDLCKREDYQVLIDIGHAHANGWNLRSVIEDLKDRIVAYHLHNNGGVHDSHRRIYDGTLDFDTFCADAKELTPSADFVLEYSLEAAYDEKGILEDIETVRKLL